LLYKRLSHEIMYSILATIPPLPAHLLPLLLGIILLVALVFVVRNLLGWRHLVAAGTPNAGGVSTTPVGKIPAPDGRADYLAALTRSLTPLAVAAVVSFALFVWSRNDIKLHSYGLLLIIGFVAATWSACLEAQRRGYDPNVILDLALPLLAASVVLCRGLYIVLNPEQFHSFAEMVRLWDGGMSFHGSLIAAVLVVAYFARRYGLRFGELADVIAPSVFLGYAIGRIGCFLNGCCYGAVCDLPWAMQFPNEHDRHLLTPPSHPAQLYSSLMALGLFFVMQRARLSPRFNRFPGQLTLLFFALYAVERFVMEVFRAGATAEIVFGTAWLTQAQVASIVGLMVIAALWKMLSRRAGMTGNRPLSANH
jgi:phosphatidylglycerol:prolipoprotein diacylglycerol transferase